MALSWLREFVDWRDGPEDLAAALTSRGVAVEAVEQPGRGAAGIVAARVLRVQPHPEAAGLHICHLRAGDRVADVVCGAPGVVPGLVAPWAVPGAVLPGGRAIGTRPVRGVPSAGMLCSAAELALPALEAAEGLLDVGHEGIAEGRDLVAALHLDDPILVLELTPNYAAHCQSILGVAREVAAITGLPCRPPGAPPVEDDRHSSAAAIRVRLDTPDLCPLYVGRVLAGLGAAGPGRLAMAHRLLQCGLRPIGAVVDVTNYVLLELGQPLHAFDLQRLVGGGVCVRLAQPGEGITTLDGRERTLEGDDLVIADAAGPVAIAGVMGGERAEVRPATSHILLESAVFAPAAIARTARRLGIPSEAAARFGRGVDAGMAAAAAQRAAALLQRLCGGAVYAGAVAAGPGVPARAATLRGRRVRALLGVRLSTAACGRQLERLGFGVQADGADRLRVIVPSHRPDVVEEVDLIEEVARAYGYDRIPPLLPGGARGTAAVVPETGCAGAARRTALGAGFSEAQPYSYEGTDLLDRLRLPADHPWRTRAVRVLNPMSAEQAQLRTHLVPGLLQSLAVNARRGRPGAALFEVGRVFHHVGPGRRPVEPLYLGAAGYGPLLAASWDQPALPCDFFALKGLVEAVLERCGIAAARLRWERDDPALPLLHPGRAARLLCDGHALGWAGETHPLVSAACDLPGPGAVAELDLGALAPLMTDGRHARAVPRFPAVRRDLAVLVPLDLPAREVEAAIRGADAEALQAVHLFDAYAGPGVPPGFRNLGFTLTYQAERTLTDEEVGAQHASVLRAVLQLPGIRPREG